MFTALFLVLICLGIDFLFSAGVVWHRVHRLFRHRILVEVGAGHLAHCHNPAFYFPHQP